MTVHDGTNDNVACTNVNDVKTKRNLTMQEQIRGKNEKTSFGRALSM